MFFDPCLVTVFVISLVNYVGALSSIRGWMSQSFKLDGNTEERERESEW